MSKIHINITQKFIDKFIIGIWCFNGLVLFKIREMDRESAFEHRIYEKVRNR